MASCSYRVSSSCSAEGTRCSQVVQSGDEPRIKELVSFLCAGQPPGNVRAMLAMDRDSVLQSLLTVDKLVQGMRLVVVKKLADSGMRWQPSMEHLLGHTGVVEAVDLVSQQVLLRFDHFHLATQAAAVSQSPVLVLVDALRSMLPQERWWFALKELKRAPLQLVEPYATAGDPTARDWVSDSMREEETLAKLYSRQAIHLHTIARSIPASRDHMEPPSVLSACTGRSWWYCTLRTPPSTCACQPSRPPRSGPSS